MRALRLSAWIFLNKNLCEFQINCDIILRLIFLFRLPSSFFLPNLSRREQIAKVHYRNAHSTSGDFCYSPRRLSFSRTVRSEHREVTSRDERYVECVRAAVCARARSIITYRVPFTAETNPLFCYEDILLALFRVLPPPPLPTQIADRTEPKRDKQREEKRDDESHRVPRLNDPASSILPVKSDSME